ncbi:TetR/AcrR family transcriptional regulator [Photobacterium sanctipauli]|uniref:TetR/AcrR family transcriptional regulator n=1 Tax=Photobacterium sanctipauli TaxID=1342794 RepID=A0A2T3NN12_9GAMM|nr:TetR/AcrR family transcriptional regulator [Photobacterium sanctipauli]PSW16872.1 TetR/AcrR family transcriptional regulator [Photobacterium sanctipauli]
MPAPKYSIAEQEQLILDAAAQCILESSLIDFKMSAIAKHAGLSMGSVYKHIQSKEDVLVALSVRLEQRAANVIEEVLALPFSLPTKIVAINLVSQEAMYLYPFGYQLMTLLNSKDLLAKASEKWLSKLNGVSNDIHHCFEGALKQAVIDNELLCAADEEEALIREFMLLQWAINVGFPQITNHHHDSYQIEEGTDASPALPLDHPLIKATVRMTNGYPWKAPVSSAELTEIEKILQQRGMR